MEKIGKQTIKEDLKKIFTQNICDIKSYFDMLSAEMMQNLNSYNQNKFLTNTQEDCISNYMNMGGNLNNILYANLLNDQFNNNNNNYIDNGQNNCMNGFS